MLESSNDNLSVAARIEVSPKLNSSDSIEANPCKELIVAPNPPKVKKGRPRKRPISCTYCNKYFANHITWASHLNKFKCSIINAFAHLLPPKKPSVEQLDLSDIHFYGQEVPPSENNPTQNLHIYYSPYTYNRYFCNFCHNAIFNRLKDLGHHFLNDHISILHTIHCPSGTYSSLWECAHNMITSDSDCFYFNYESSAAYTIL